jgi:hypothetical protein
MQRSPRYGCSTVTPIWLEWRIRNSSNSVVRRWRSGLSGRNSSSNCSARSKVAISISLPVNMRLQLRETSFSVNNFALLLDRHGNSTLTTFHSIGFDARLQSSLWHVPRTGRRRQDRQIRANCPGNVSSRLASDRYNRSAPALIDSTRGGTAFLAQTEIAARFTANWLRLS